MQRKTVDRMLAVLLAVVILIGGGFRMFPALSFGDDAAEEELRDDEEMTEEASEPATEEADGEEEVTAEDAATAEEEPVTGPARASGDTYNTYSTGETIIEYGATGTPNSYCTNLKVDDGGTQNVFCIEPGVNFAGGTKQRVDALTVFPQEELTRLALGVYYLSTIEPPAGLSRLGWQQYWIWVEGRRYTVPNVTDIWVRNGPTEAVQDQTLAAIRDYVDRNARNYTGHGYIYTDGSSQRVARYWVETNARVSVQKRSAGNSSIVNILPELYSLEGAEFIIYDSRSYAGSSIVARMTTDANGVTSSAELTPGKTYYLVEYRAPKGFNAAVNMTYESPYEFTLSAGQDLIIEAFDHPDAEPLSLMVRKTDRNGDPLSGAEFEIKYYPTIDSIEGMEPRYRWVMSSDDGGSVSLDEAHLVSGDDLIKRDDGTAIAPVGTYVIRETEAPGGFFRNDEEFVKTVTYDHDGASIVQVYDAPVVVNTPVPSVKTRAFYTDTNTKGLQKGIDISVTDKVGMENLIVGEEYALRGELVDPDTGKMVSGGSVSFTAGSEYVTKDVPFRVNTSDLAGKSLVITETLIRLADGEEIVEAMHGDLTDAEQTISVIDIGTEASDKDGDKSVLNSGVQTVIDTVSYTGLIPGTEYTVKGHLVNYETGEDILDASGNLITGTLVFTPEEQDGSVEIEISFDAELLKGGTYVVFEECYEGETLVAVHADINDVYQQFVIPDLKTMAVDMADGDKNVLNSGVQTVVDTVEYTGLAAGTEYVMTAHLVNEETGEDVYDASGSRITGTKSFTPESSSGTVDVEISFDAELLKGASYTVFEECYAGDDLIAVHEDISDSDQKFVIPDIKTNASDKADGDSSVLNLGIQTVIDTVSYTGLIPQTEYVMTAHLVYAETGEDVLDDEGNFITGSVTFIPEDPDGEVVVEISFDAELLKGKTYVVFEECHLGDTLIAIHADVSDTDQQFVIPDLRTTVRDKADGDKAVYNRGKQTVVDSVDYTGLVPGNEYTLKASLVNAMTGKAVKDADEVPLVFEKKLTPEGPSGTAEIELSFDADPLKGETYVVYEDCYSADTLVASHSDVNDSDQQFVIPDMKTTATSDGKKEAFADGKIRITDVISYVNFEPGEYLIKGEAVRKDSKTVISTAEKKVKISEPDGTIEMEISVDTKDLAGKDIVIFETAFRTGNGEPYAEHADIDDEGQTIRIKEKPVVPKTGDTARPMLYVGLSATALVLAAAIIFIKKRKK